MSCSPEVGKDIQGMITNVIYSIRDWRTGDEDDRKDEYSIRWAEISHNIPI